MNNIAVQNKNLYNEILRTYKRSQIAFLKLETSKTTQSPKIVIDKVLENLSNLMKLIKKFKIVTLRQYYPPDTIKKIQANLMAHKDQIRQLEKKVIAMKYFDKIAPKIGGYVNEIGLGIGEIREFGTKYNLMKQFLTIILHPNNILDLKSQLSALGKGTMTIPTFGRWFRNTMFPTGMPSKEKLTGAEYAGKYGHPEAWKRSKDEFQSLKSYKKEKAEHAAGVKFRKKTAKNG